MLSSLVLASLLALTGCQGQESTNTWTLVRDAQTDALPAAAGDVVLDILDGATVRHALDMTGLAQLRTVETTILEPFLETEHTYTGVPFPDFLDLVGLADASSIRFTALDDYAVTLTPDDLQAAILATHEDGHHIEVDKGGPIRLIFTGDAEVGRNTDNWIWSIRTMGRA